jgi:hypothetical protein
MSFGIFNVVERESKGGKSPTKQGHTSKIASAPNSFLHLSISAHICVAFSESNFLAFRNLH